MKPLTIADLNKVKQRVENGESLTSVARELGIKPNTLYAQYRRTFGNPGPCGRHGKPVITKEMLIYAANRIKKDRKVSLNSIARELGVNQNTLRAAYRRAGYKNRHGPGNTKHWLRVKQAEEAMKDWRNNEQGMYALDSLIDDLVFGRSKGVVKGNASK